MPSVRRQSAVVDVVVPYLTPARRQSAVSNGKNCRQFAVILPSTAANRRNLPLNRRWIGKYAVKPPLNAATLPLLPSVPSNSMDRQKQREYRVSFPQQEADKLDGIAAEAGIRTSELIRQRVRRSLHPEPPTSLRPPASTSSVLAPSESGHAVDASLVHQQMEATVAQLIGEHHQTRDAIAHLLAENQALHRMLEEVQQEIPLLSNILALAVLTRKEVEALILIGDHVLVDVAPDEHKSHRQALLDSMQANLTHYAARLGIEAPPKYP